MGLVGKGALILLLRRAHVCGCCRVVVGSGLRRRRSQLFARVPTAAAQEPERRGEERNNGKEGTCRNTTPRAQSCSSSPPLDGLKEEGTNLAPPARGIKGLPFEYEYVRLD